ncbi:condensation domain protein [Pelosinus fermentans]|uniref:Condensation domain protein n=1 Tax=Pelosinus fermentans JBW45 TaxID=1192197 RepID=I8TYZ8_9FIRM|nr:condensation domain protein [Pelosinus fermentans]AJQ26584.1 condensation domain protein [Pelosinus fermentans JBW45]
MKKSPIYFPPVAQDIGNYLTGKHFTNNQINCVLKLNGRINDTMLKQAVRISLDVEPILGCCLIEENNNLVWKRNDNIEETELCSTIETKEDETELQNFISTPFNSTNDCQIKIKVLRAEFDTICVKLNHTCSDVEAFKQYLNLLSSIYNHLFYEQPYIVEPSVYANRSQEHILNLTADINAICNKPNPSPTVAFPCTIGESQEQKFLLRQLNFKQLNSITSYAHKNGATTNDILLTGFHRSLSKIAKIQDNTISIHLTVNLRRYLPANKKMPICNFSGKQIVMSTQNINESFNETLAKIVHETTKIKKDWPGLKSAFELEKLGKLNLKYANAHIYRLRNYTIKNKVHMPVFSNVGVITKDTTKFGFLDILDCYMIGPAPFSPGLVMLASIFNNTLSLSVNFYQSTTKKVIVEQFVDTMLNELVMCMGE